MTTLVRGKSEARRTKKTGKTHKTGFVALLEIEGVRVCWEPMPQAIATTDPQER